MLGAGMLLLLKLDGDRVIEVPQPPRPSAVGRA